MPEQLLAIEIGGTKLQLALGDASGRIAERARLAVDPAMNADDLKRGIAGVIGAWRPKGSL
ncbi:MAG: hypothetical protein ACREH8_20020, partial [Opitutaceae bacterium]